MEVKITTTIDKLLYGGDGNNTSNLQKLQSIVIGGSTDKYETPTGYDPAAKLENDFTIKDSQTFEFDLDENNAFNKDILTLINSPAADLTLLHVFCIETENAPTILPVKFKVSAEINGVGGTVELGEMTVFSLQNMKVNKFTKLFINSIIVPPESKALLVISLGSRNKNI